MTTTTRSTLRQELGLLIGSCKTGTASANGNAGGTTIVDTTNFADSYMNANFYDGWYAILTSGTYSGQVRRVSSYAGATGTITVADAYGGQVASTVTFELHTYDPAELNNAINRALVRCYYWTVVFPTLITDGDMEASGTTNWTASGCTLAKETTAVKYGIQSLAITSTGLANYARTASMSVTPNDFYYLDAIVRPDNNTCSLVVYDVTNSAAITLTTSTSNAGREWKRLYTSFQVPSGCEQIQVRLSVAEASGVTYWDNVVLQKTTHKQLYLPSWITEKGNVVRVQHMPTRPRTDVASTSGAVMVDEDEWYDCTPAPRVLEDRTAVNPAWLEFSHEVGYMPYRAICVRPFGTLTSDTATTTANKEWVLHGALLELLRMGVLRAPGSQTKEFQQMVKGWKADWQRLCRDYQPKVRQVPGSLWDA